MTCLRPMRIDGVLYVCVLPSGRHQPHQYEQVPMTDDIQDQRLTDAEEERLLHWLWEQTSGGTLLASLRDEVNDILAARSVRDDPTLRERIAAALWEFDGYDARPSGTWVGPYLARAEAVLRVLGAH